MKNSNKQKFPWVERDVSWMYFNHRILEEAQRTDVPLLERLSFLGIYSNNLDEFFAVRIATLNHIAAAKSKALRHEAEAAMETIKTIGQLNESYAKEYIQTINEVKTELDSNGIHIVDDAIANKNQRTAILQMYQKNISGNVQSVWLKNISQLEGESEDDIYLAVACSKVDTVKKQNYAVIKIPVQSFGRFFQLPDIGGEKYFMYIDDVVRYCLPWLFAGTPYDQFSAYSFKITKDAEMEIDNDFDISKMQKVQKGVKSRRRGAPIRLEYDETMPRELLKKIVGQLNINKTDTVLPGERYLNHKDFITFPGCGRKDLKYPVWAPLRKPEFSGSASVLQLIHDSDRFLHVPYHSFNAYLRFLREASLLPSVRAIKITLYRLAAHSKVVDTLIAAAKNRKKVTVVIELLARFDEANNIYWSKRMQDAGINVIFGVEGLKVHSKITLIEMTIGNVACIGTGNFHEGNARVYTDCLLFTAYRPIVKDIENVFNFIRTPFKPVKFHELLVSPNSMKDKILGLISNEIKNRKMGRPAYMKIKMNSITDEEIIAKLYQAAHVGVQIDLLLRGNCCLKTVNTEVAPNIRIRGIIDRYLEHARILIFCNNDDPLYFIGSADWMPRNLDNRIEVMTPVYDPVICAELLRIIDYGMRDNRQARIVDGSGENRIAAPANQVETFRSQEELYKYYSKQINN